MHTNQLACKGVSFFNFQSSPKGLYFYYVAGCAKHF